MTSVSVHTVQSSMRYCYYRGGGGARIFFSDLEICMSQSDMLCMAKPCALLGGFGGMLPRENFLKWCNLVGFGVYFDHILSLKIFKNYHFLYKKLKDCNFLYKIINSCQLCPRYEGQLTRMAEPIPPSGQSSSYSLTTLSSSSSTDQRAETDRKVITTRIAVAHHFRCRLSFEA